MSLPTPLTRLRRGLLTFAGVLALGAALCAAPAFAVVNATPAWTPQVSGGAGVIYSTVVSSDTEYIGGSFTSITDSSGNPSAVSNFAEIDTQTGLLENDIPSVGGTIYSMALDGTTLYIGGASAGTGLDITNAGGGAPLARAGAAAIDVTTGDATSWNPQTFGIGADTGDVYTVAVGNGDVFIAGDFDKTDDAGGTPTIRTGLAEYRASDNTLLPFDPGVNQLVFSLRLVGTTLYAGGNFTLTDDDELGDLTGDNADNAANGLAAFDTTRTSGPWDETSWSPNLNAGAEVDAITDDGDGTLYVGGGFSSVGADTRQNLAAISESTGLATNFNVPVDATADIGVGGPTAYGAGSANGVRALALDHDNLYVGGYFTGIGTAVAQTDLGAASLADGTVDTTFVPDPNDGSGTAQAVNSLATQQDGTLGVGGYFAALGATAASSGIYDEFPENVAPPVVSGTLQVGQSLMCSQGTWEGTDNTYSYQWLRGGTAITGATSPSYTTAAADGGQTLACKVTGENSLDTTGVSATSANVSVAAPVVTGGGTTPAPTPVVTVTTPPSTGSNALVVVITNVPKSTSADSSSNLPADVLCNHTCRSVARVYVSGKQAKAIGLLSKGQATHSVLIGNASVVQTGTSTVKLTVTLSKNALARIKGHKVTLLVNYIKTTDGIHTVYNTKSITITIPKK